MRRDDATRRDNVVRLLVMALSCIAAFVLGCLVTSRSAAGSALPLPQDRMLLTWDQCNEFFWPKDEAPDWGCVCKMAPVDIVEPLDLRTRGRALPVAIGRKARRKDYSMWYRLPVEQDEPVLTHEAHVIKTQRADGSSISSIQTMIDAPPAKSGDSALWRPSPLMRHLSLRSHGLPLECPGLASGERHYFEGIAEMINHSPNATTSVCAELFELDASRGVVTRYTMQLCATRNQPRGGWEMTGDYGTWTPTGAYDRGKRNDQSWIRDMLSRAADNDGADGRGGARDRRRRRGSL